MPHARYCAPALNKTASPFWSSVRRTARQLQDGAVSAMTGLQKVLWEHTAGIWPNLQMGGRERASGKFQVMPTPSQVLKVGEHLWDKQLRRESSASVRTQTSVAVWERAASHCSELEQRVRGRKEREEGPERLAGPRTPRAWPVSLGCQTLSRAAGSLWGRRAGEWGGDLHPSAGLLCRART